jgi:hypothetical protein
MREREVNHIATGRSLSPGGELLLILGDIKVDGDGGEVDREGEDGDGDRWRWLRGHFPSRQGARIETSVPRNLSTAAAELRDSFWKIADSPRVFRLEALYRQRGIVRGLPGAPPT